jgi:hypothetical protein
VPMKSSAAASSAEASSRMAPRTSSVAEIISITGSRTPPGKVIRQSRSSPARIGFSTGKIWAHSPSIPFAYLTNPRTFWNGNSPNAPKSG